MKSKLTRLFALTLLTVAGVMGAMGVPVFANGNGFGAVTFNTSTLDNAKADTLMSNIIGILLTITRWVGVAIVVFGVYEIVMSFTQDMPEKKVKGITLALAGVIMIALKSLLAFVGIK